MRRAFALLRQHQPLADAEAVLLVNHHHREILVCDRVLKNRMGAGDNIDAAIHQPHQNRFARPALVAPGEQRDIDTGSRQHATERGKMLAGKDFGWREQGSLSARLDRDQHRFQRHDSLARADVALQQPQHRGGLRQIALDLTYRALLGSGQRKGKMQIGAQQPVALQRRTHPRAIGIAHQHQRQAVGE